MSKDDEQNVLQAAQAPHNVLNQVPFQGAVGDDGRDWKPLTLCDFDVRHLPRALFCVPAQKSGLLVTMHDGHLMTQKQAVSKGGFLTLRERVQFRRRVSILNSRLLIFPLWDFDGPDLRFFGEFHGMVPECDGPFPTHFEVGPWVIDGRLVVADAKDMVVMMAEAAAGKGVKKLAIRNPYGTDMSTGRGWSLGRSLHDAFWSGVRKAADALIGKGMEIVAVAEKNPFSVDTFAKFSESVPWDAAECVGFEAFALAEASLAEVLPRHGISSTPPLLTCFIAAGNSARSQWQPELRTKLWDPEQRLQILPPENKAKWQTRHFSEG